MKKGGFAQTESARQPRLEPQASIVSGSENSNGVVGAGAGSVPSASAECSEEDNMVKSVNRSAGSGRFVSKTSAARWPGKTTTERVGFGTSNSRAVNRSASTGKFVTSATARRNPGGTITQQI